MSKPGERARQRRTEELPKVRERLYKQAECELGRDLTPEEMRRFDATAREIVNLPIHPS